MVSSREYGYRSDREHDSGEVLAEAELERNLSNCKFIRDP